MIPQSKEGPTAVAVELQAYVDQARVQGMEQIDDLVYYHSSNNDDDDDDTFHDAIQVKDFIEDTNDDEATIYGEPINNESLAQIGQEDGATGVTINHKGVLYAQYCHTANDCHYGELYYQSCEICGDDPVETEEAIDRMAHSSE